MKNIVIVLGLFLFQISQASEVVELKTIDGKMAQVRADEAINAVVNLKKSPEAFKANIVSQPSGSTAIVKDIYITIEGKNYGVRAGSEDIVCQVSGYKNALKWTGHTESSAKALKLTSLNIWSPSRLWGGRFEMVTLDRSGKPLQIEAQPWVHWMLDAVFCIN